MPFSILRSLMNNMGTIIIVAYFLSRLRIFKNLVIKKRNRPVDKIIMSMIFGCIGILATYTGVSVNGAIANSRIVGVLVGGIYGGPLVGFGAGLIAGFHRWAIDIGGFTAIACMISTILEGLIGGFASKYIENQKYKWVHALFIGIFAETLQMIIILVTAKPYADALELVRIIWIPMVLFNPVGIALLVALIEGIYKEQEREAAIQTQLALNIAEKCLPYLEKGLKNMENIHKVAEIILDMTDAAAVAITDKTHILAHVGISREHHIANKSIMTALTVEALEKGELRVGQTKGEIGCIDENCKLKSVVVVPLFKKGEPAGAIKIYKTRENAVTDVDTRLAMGLARLFSSQLELADAEYQVKLRQKAELKALQSQINPHFLFNALNTIVSFCRTNPERARELLINLSTYFRNTLGQGEDFVSLETELKHVNAYLAIEKARFGEKLIVNTHIDSTIDCRLPQLILQPLVENAVKHGLMKKEDGGQIHITARKVEPGTLIRVEDSGEGIDEVVVSRLYSGEMPKSKVGLSNVHNRLKSIYGEAYGLKLYRGEDGGTVVEMLIPKNELGVTYEAQNTDS